MRYHRGIAILSKPSHPSPTWLHKIGDPPTYLLASEVICPSPSNWRVPSLPILNRKSYAENHRPRIFHPVIMDRFKIFCWNFSFPPLISFLLKRLSPILKKKVNFATRYCCFYLLLSFAISGCYFLQEGAQIISSISSSLLSPLSSS